MKKILIMFIFAVCLFTGCSTNESTIKPSQNPPLSSKNNQGEYRQYDFTFAEDVESYEFYIEIYENGEWEELNTVPNEVIMSNVTVQFNESTEFINIKGNQFDTVIYLEAIEPEKSENVIYSEYEIQKETILEEKTVIFGYFGRNDNEPISYDASIDLKDFDIDYGLFITVRLN